MQRPPAHPDAGARLAELLVSRGLSQRAFARRAGIPRGTLRRSLAGYEPGVTVALASTSESYFRMPK
jgi:transcriptional regulator with XRE-family HTH domain